MDEMVKCVNPLTKTSLNKGDGMFTEGGKRANMIDQTKWIKLKILNIRY